MSAAREEILGRIRTALAGTTSSGPVPREYRSQGSHAPGTPALLELLTDRLVDYRASVTPCPGEDALADAVIAVLDRRGVRVLACPPSPPVDLSGWSAWPQGVRIDDPGAPLTVADLDAADGVLTACAVAVAETGTIVLDASADQGRRALTLVPDYHLLIVRAEQVVQTVPEALTRLAPTRPLTWISGPSATSDIELSRVEGVHGPRTLDVVLVGG